MSPNEYKATLVYISKANSDSKFVISYQCSLSLDCAYIEDLIKSITKGFQA